MILGIVYDNLLVCSTFKTFDHIINGVLHQIDRGKPKLRPNAVPKLNLPEDDSAVTDTKQHATGEPLRKSKKQREVVNLIRSEVSTKTRRPIIKRLLKETNKKRAKDNTKNGTNHEKGESIDDCTFLDNVNSTAGEHIDVEQLNVEMHAPKCDFDDIKVELPYRCEKIDERIGDVETLDELPYGCVDDPTLFDGIYEDIYEVTLPNTLWGVHRDPNRMFIVFSYFDAETCSTSKLVHVDSAMNAQIYVRGKSIKKWLSSSSLSIEYLTSLVSEVDEYRICEKFDPNGRHCKVVAVEGNLCTVCRLIKD